MVGPRVPAVCQNPVMSSPGAPTGTEADAPQPWWRQGAAWVGKKLAENAIGALWPVAALAAAAAIAIARKWIAREWACIEKPWCTVSGWSLGFLILIALALVAATCLLAAWVLRLRVRLAAAAAALTTAEAERTAAVEAAARARRGKTPDQPPPFRPINVDDERLHLRWQLRKPPAHWLGYDLSHQVAPNYVQEALDGPFHSVLGCQERLEESGGGSGYGRSSPYLEPRCPGCRRFVFSVRQEPGEYHSSAYVWQVRAQALGELQRMHRNGNALEGERIVLARPQYWQRMMPP